jgi:hypothetical protein
MTTDPQTFHQEQVYLLLVKTKSRHQIRRIEVFREFAQATKRQSTMSLAPDELAVIEARAFFGEVTR